TRNLPRPGKQGRSIPLELQRHHKLHDRLWRGWGGHLQTDARDVVWLKGNAYEKTASTYSQGTHQPDFSHGAPAPSFRVMGADMHGTIRPQQKIDTVFLVAYLIVIAIAAIVIWIHPKPELIPLLLWHAGRPL